MLNVEVALFLAIGMLMWSESLFYTIICACGVIYSLFLVIFLISGVGVVVNMAMYLYIGTLLCVFSMISTFSIGSFSSFRVVFRNFLAVTLLALWVWADFWVWGSCLGVEYLLSGSLVYLVAVISIGIGVTLGVKALLAKEKVVIRKFGGE